MTELTVGSLFSGIGGLDLGLERAGMRVVWQSEIDPYANRVLAKHWPDVPNLGDIKEIEWSKVERPDVICGGYPCQPFSQAGRRRGEEDPRHLWPWVKRCIGELRPRYAVLENVRGHLSLGGTTVIGELASIGYDAEWRVVSAASVGANHRRDRIIIVAYPNNAGPHREKVHPAETWQSALSWARGRGANVAYPNNAGRNEQRRPFTASAQNSSTKCGCTKMADSEKWVDVRWHGKCQHHRPEVFGKSNFRRRTPIYAVGQWWETEPDVGRVADGVPSRVDRLRGLGNAVVPQVAEVIGRLVVQHWKETNGI